MCHHVANVVEGVRSEGVLGWALCTPAASFQVCETDCGAGAVRHVSADRRGRVRLHTEVWILLWLSIRAVSGAPASRHPKLRFLLRQYTATPWHAFARWPGTTVPERGDMRSCRSRIYPVLSGVPPITFLLGCKFGIDPALHSIE